jgi:phosphoglycolate phosphatase/AHBA synthesis associated protein
VLFDLDGVLVDSYEVWFVLLNAASRAFGAAAISRPDFEAAWGQGIHEDQRRFFPMKSVAEIEAWYHAHFMAHAEHLRVDADAARVLAALRAERVPTALVTNTPSPLARAILAHAGLELDRVVGGTDVAHAKPAPDMVLHACELLAVRPGQAALVGDSDYDRAAARAAGVRFIGFRTAGDLRIERLADLLS